MQVPVSEAKSQLTDLVRKAEAGEDVVLTRHGQATVRLVPVRRPADPLERRRVLEAARARASSKAVQGEPSARSQDFLYDDNGLPR